MPTFAPAKPVGIFNPRDEMVVLTPFMQMRPGQPCPRGSYSKLRLWWRRGYIAARKDVDPEMLKQIEKDYAGSVHQDAPTPVKETSVEDRIPEQEEEVSEPTALMAEEGTKGWWKVSFDDGTEKSMRRADVESLGLLGSDDGSEV